jgi:release factor glutamine methyltransferase
MSNQFNSKRQLSVYEKQQLIKYGLKEIDFLQKGEMPVEHFTNKVDFADLTLNIGQEALIPRIETEELVKLAIEVLADYEQDNIRILDLGTGCGAISLSLMNYLIKTNYQEKNWHFYLTDVSANALKLAQRNYDELLLHGVDERFLKIDFLISDLLDKVPKNLKPDLVLANLPYIPSTKIEGLTSSVKNFEPLMALDGGKTGFDLVAEALRQLLTGDFLNNNATLLFETDENHDYQFVKKNFPFVLDVFETLFLKDQFARQRFLKLRKK